MVIESSLLLYIILVIYSICDVSQIILQAYYRMCILLMVIESSFIIYIISYTSDKRVHIRVTCNTKQNVRKQVANIFWVQYNFHRRVLT